MIRHSVCWRARDGKGTHVFASDLTRPEGHAEMGRCHIEHPEATMIWLSSEFSTSALEVMDEGQVKASFEGGRGRQDNSPVDRPIQEPL